MTLLAGLIGGLIALTIITIAAYRRRHKSFYGLSKTLKRTRRLHAKRCKKHKKELKKKWWVSYPQPPKPPKNKGK